MGVGIRRRRGAASQLRQKESMEEEVLRRWGLFLLYTTPLQCRGYMEEETPLPGRNKKILFGHGMAENGGRDRS
jgi:hypothetical protein